MNLITLDTETFYSKEFSLSKITTESYIRDDQFEVIGVAVKVNDEDTQWFSGSFEDTKVWLQQFDWDNSMMLAHNNAFDAAILSWRFDIHPKILADTMSMGNAVGDGAGSVSLKALSEKYHLGEKGTEVLNALGKRRADFTPEELARYGEYCINDANLCYAVVPDHAGQWVPQG
jgi:DNA polymerase I-like protein with 3'-5' exonuclease and polymerase domains